MEREVADWPVRRYRYHHYDFPNLLSLPSLFRHRGMRVEPSQGCGLVRNLAGLLGDPVEVAGNKLRLPIFIVIARSSTELFGLGAGLVAPQRKWER